MVYLIEKITFDSLENDISAAIIHRIVGYCDLEKEADELVTILNKNKKYKGWDGEYYPNYRILPVDKIPEGFKGD